MVHKKTGWYSFVAPVLVGALAADADERTAAALGRFAMLLGIAFQIQDDLLSLEGDEGVVGKEFLGDLWEGKYTLALLHTLRVLAPDQRAQALAILAKGRPSTQPTSSEAQARAALYQLIATGGLALSPAETTLLRDCLLGDDRRYKSADDVQLLAKLVLGRNGESVKHARAHALARAKRARSLLVRDLRALPESVHKQFLASLISFVVERSL
jgi:geranylgeranyl diphosphate synthase type II